MSSATTVLVADDQARFRERVAALLEKGGFRVLQAADGRQALATVRRELPDVVVLDLVMPHMDGLEVVRAMRSDPVLPYIPVLFYSGRSATASRVDALRAGGDDFTPKDIDPDELLARVEALSRIKQVLDGRGRTPGQRDDKTAPSLPDQQTLDRVLGEEFKRAQAHNEPLTILLVVAAGGPPSRSDARIAAMLLRCCRGNDSIARLDDGGFAMVLPSTHFGGAMAMAERAWRALEPRRGGSPFPGVYIGGACYPNPEVSSAASLLDFARASLDRARAEGSAHVCLYHHQAYIFRPE